MLPEAAFSRAESVLTSARWNRISDDERSTLLSSLSGDDRQGHAPQSGEAISTQKQLKDEMSADLVDARKADEDCKTNYVALIAAEMERSPVQQARADVTSTSMKRLTQRGQCSSCIQFKVQLRCCVQVKSRRPLRSRRLRVRSACLAQQSAQSVFETIPEVSKADMTSTIEAENAAGLVEMVNEPDGSRVQPTHHGRVWGIVPYLPNSRHVNTVNNPLHITTTRAGALVSSTILPGWRATRAGPSQYPQYTRAPKMGGGCG